MHREEAARELREARAVARQAEAERVAALHRYWWTWEAHAMDRFRAASTLTR